MKFSRVVLGQSVMRYETPLNIFESIINIYNSNSNKLIKANNQLAGKIEDEKSLYYDGQNEEIMKKHNYLPINITSWFYDMFRHYLYTNHVKEYQLHLNSIWINQMKENEYNPIHVHLGTSYTGLSSVMILKQPSTTGVEYSASESPQNGKLQFLGASNGQFARVDYQPPAQVRDFYIFPYDMRHCVYPFNSTKDTRITLAANCDVDYNPVKNRGVT